MKASIFLSATAVLAFALPALAAPTANVSAKDLDLSKSADVATFNTRLDAAAKKACKGQAEMQLNSERRFVRCETLAKAQAVAHLPEASRTALAAVQGSNGAASL